MATYRKVRTAKGEERWEVQVRKRGLSRTGRARTLDAAKKLGRKLEDEIDLFRVEGVADKSVKDAIDQYIATELAGAHAASDRRNVETQLAWWSGRLGSVRLRDLRVALIRAALDQAPGKSASTRNKYLTRLSKVLSVASREWEWLPVNPCRSLRRRRPDPGRVRMLTDDERTKLLNCCRADPNRRLYPMVLFALRTGCRLGEIEALRVADVDVTGNQAWIAKSKNGKARFVHLHEEVIAAMVALTTAKPRPDGLVFGRLPKWGWPRARKKAGLEGWHFHDLRHDFASRLGRRGMSAPQIATALGHSGWVMSSKYVHDSSSDARDIIRSLD